MEEKKYTVYIHTNKINNKAYIGITSKKPKQRWDNGNGYKRQPYFWRAIQKYGWDNFKHIIFMTDLTKERACYIERMLIALFDTTNRNKGYNIQIGGETGNAGIPMSEETKIKLSKAKTGCIPTLETRLKQSLSQKKRWTEEERIRRSEEYSGDGNPMFGVHRYGEQNPMYGKKHSDESKNKMSQTKLAMENKNRIPVICLETGTIYSSTYEVERQTGICQQNVAACCRHEKYRKTAGGYHWEYINEEKIA